MNLLVGIIPAIGWGVLPVILVKLGGTADEQLLGTTVGNILIAILIALFISLQGDWRVVLLCFLSGFLWGIGQWGQYRGYSTLGVSKAMPISSGLQIVGNTLFGGFVFHEWHNSGEVVSGLIGVMVIVLGILLCSNFSLKTNVHFSREHSREYFMLFITTIGYWCYSILPKFIVESHTNVYSKFIFQAVGMLTISIILTLLPGGVTQFKYKIGKLRTLTVGGIVFSVAAIAYVYSLQHNSLITAFTLSQMNVVISTILGFLLLHEDHEHKQKVFSGLFLIVFGGCILMWM